MNNNGFGIENHEYDKIKNDVAYFRGRVVEKLNHIEEELIKQTNVDDKIKNKIKKLPCTKNSNKIIYALLLIAVLFVLIGYDNFPLIMKFFGF